MMGKLPGIDKGAAGLQHFMGVIEDVEGDPLELGRVKVRIMNENDVDTPTPLEDMQWCTILMPMTTPSVEGVGTSPTWALVGSHVIGIYLDGMTKRLPLLIGTFNMIPENDINRHDVSKLARGENTVTIEQLGPEPASPFAAKYPHNKVVTTKGGHIIEIDDTEGEERLHIYHKSGSYVWIDKEGTMTRKVIGKDFQIVAKDSEVHIEGKSNVKIVGNSTITVEGNVVQEVSGTYKVKSGGIMSFEAPKINLNEGS